MNHQGILKIILRARIAVGGMETFKIQCKSDASLVVHSSFLPSFLPSFLDIYFVSCIKLGAHVIVEIKKFSKNCFFQPSLTQLFPALSTAASILLFYHQTAHCSAGSVF